MTLSHLIAWLWGCTHPRTTFPMNQRVRGVENSPYSYTVCLTCGREFDYDFRAMAIVGEAPEVNVEMQRALAHIRHTP